MSPRRTLGYAVLELLEVIGFFLGIKLATELQGFEAKYAGFLLTVGSLCALWATLVIRHREMTDPTLAIREGCKVHSRAREVRTPPLMGLSHCPPHSHELDSTLPEKEVKE